MTLDLDAIEARAHWPTTADTRALVAEVRRLRHEAVYLRREVEAGDCIAFQGEGDRDRLIGRSAGRLQERVAEAGAEIDRLRAALWKYGRHPANCPSASSTENRCTCGLDAALTEFRRKAPAESLAPEKEPVP